MNLKPLVGLGGASLAVAFAELNDQVASGALADISGGLGLGADAASWIRTLYLCGVVLGALVGPSMAVAFTQRLFLLAAVGLACASSLLTVISGDFALVYISRGLQGLAQGAIISNLIAVVLVSLPPTIRLYGLIFYAATATVIPNLATSVAALWTDVVVDWRFVFLEAIPLGGLSAVLIWFGMPAKPLQLDKMRRYDWWGVFTGALGMGALTIALSQGERLDWSNSRTIMILFLVSVLGIGAFVYRELTTHAPLVGLKLFRKRNLVYPVLALILFIVVGLSGGSAPVAFLSQVQGYRPLQAQTVSLQLALIQLVALPATAWLLDHPWADARLVGAAGLFCILAACLLGVRIDSTWLPRQFLVMQSLQGLGQALFIMPLLMTATNALKPEEGVLGSALINAPRAVSEAAGVALLAYVQRARGAYHDTQILDALGRNRLALAQLGRIPASVLHNPLSGRGPGVDALQSLNAAVRQQSATLATIDLYLVFAGLAFLVLLLTLFVPVRTLPPRLALAKS